MVINPTSIPQSGYSSDLNRYTAQEEVLKPLQEKTPTLSSAEKTILSRKVEKLLLLEKHAKQGQSIESTGIRVLITAIAYFFGICFALAAVGHPSAFFLWTASSILLGLGTYLFAFPSIQDHLIEERSKELKQLSKKDPIKASFLVELAANKISDLEQEISFCDETKKKELFLVKSFYEKLKADLEGP